MSNITPSDRVPFAPEYVTAGTGAFESSVTVAAGAAHTASAQFPARGGNQIQIANYTNQIAFIQVGVYGSVTASTAATGYPVAPNGGTVVITVQPEVTGADVILAGAPGAITSVIFTMGIGG